MLLPLFVFFYSNDTGFNALLVSFCAGAGSTRNPHFPKSPEEPKLVYIGPEAEDYVPDGILNLSGQTSFDELLVLLKHAKLHVGPEGGMIHMRHALCGLPSCVLFGPTSATFYGYAENHNLETGGVCISSCEWMVDHWQGICLKTNSNICKKLQALGPEAVFDVISFYL